MIIYNTVDDPVTIIIEGTTYHMEPDSELELSLASGTYSYRMYKTDSKGIPLAKGYDIGYHRHYTTICYAESGLLINKRGTKIYIRETTETLFQMFSHRRPDRIYEASMFDVTAVDGELTERRRGCLNDEMHAKVLRTYKVSLWIQLAFHLLFLILAILFGLGVFSGIHRTVSYAIAAGCMLMQAALIDLDLQQIRLLRMFKTLPILFHDKIQL